MMDAIVQFIRNALSVVKDLELFKDTFLWDASVTGQYYDFPEPLHKTTPLEVILSIVQSYVVYSGVPSSWNLLVSSYGKLNRINRLMDKSGAVKDDVDRLINASLAKEAFYALRSMFIGFNVLCISFSFIWLAANSWHITETDWIGGVQALIHALTVMNICLTPLLIYMYRDGMEQLAKAKRMEMLSQKMREGNLTVSDVALPSFEALSDWLPFWDSGVGLFQPIDEKAEEKLMVQEKAKVKAILASITTSTEKTKKGDKEDDLKDKKQKMQEKAEELEGKVQRTRLEGYREFLYLLLNFIAWYGYGACVVVYYWNKEEEQPTWMRYALLHLNNTDADWTGNFYGDVMWTIEPVVILASPIYLDSLVSKKKEIDKAKTE